MVPATSGEGVRDLVDLSSLFHPKEAFSSVLSGFWPVGLSGTLKGDLTGGK